MKYTKSIILSMVFLLIFAEMVLGSAIEKEYEQAKEIGELIGYNHGLVYDYIPKLSEVIATYESFFNNKDSIHRNYFIEGYYEGFEKSYKQDIKKPDFVEYVEYADILGLTLGEIYGNRDCYDGKKYSPRIALPSDNTLIANYNLNKLTSQDKFSFLRTFKDSFEAGYREGYIRANFNSIKTSYEDGMANGERFGSIAGEMAGVKDYFNGLSNNYKRNMPTDKKIESNYSLNNDLQEYREGFIEGFKRAYDESYNKSYTNIKMDENIKSYDNGYANGKESGIIQGQSLAVEDFYKDMDNDWKRHSPSNSEIIRDYNLFLQSTVYRNSFVHGFIEGLYEGYTEKYGLLHRESITNKTVSEIIPISGGQVKTADNVFTLAIEKGTYYNPVAIKVESLSPVNYNNEGLINASNLYRVNISNSSSISNDEKFIEFSFEYYGGDNGGIYKLVEGEWLYIPSRIEEESIKAFVKPSSIKDTGNIYGVFVDKEYKILIDVRSHWAKDEILTYQRRGIVSGYSDRTFRPDKEITKGEFFAILNRVYKWHKANSYKSSPEDVIKYALEKGYLEDSSLTAMNTPISYREVETIMRKILNSENFQWYNVAANMLYKKQHRCNSYYSKDNKMTRAEAIYMLYIINEWRF